jgi:group I intron endonuclease
MDGYGIVYVLKNKINGKCYVGQTISSLSNRIYDHKKNKSIIGMAILKYGIENFERHQFKGISINLLDYTEIQLIKRLNTVCPNGYNIMLGGQANRIFSEETKLKMSIAHIGKKQTKEEIEKRVCSLRGKKRPVELMEKLKQYNIGRVVSKETKEKIRQSLLGNTPWNKGKKMSEEVNKKNSECHKGYRHSEETKRKMRESHKKRLKGE